MKHIFLLSGDCTEIGKEEVISLSGIKNFKVADRLLIVELENDEKSLMELCRRLALTKSAYKLLFECKAKDIKKSMKSFDWNSIYKDNFCLRMHNLSDNKKTENIEKNNQIKRYSEKDLAGCIWRSVNKPKVNLENPKTKIELFIINGNVYCGLLIYENCEGFESRKSHLRPFPNPSSLHPKLARALVNISGARENETLLDPFCGTGGFLIEAGLMGIKATGCDISKNMANGCKENLKNYKIGVYKISNKNALGIKNSFDYVVTDLPYGLNSNCYLHYNKNSLKGKSNKINLKINKNGSIKILEGFYLKFLKSLRKKLRKKAVIVFPSYVDYRNLLKSAKFNIEKEFEIYVHRSLKREIVKIS